MDLEICAQCGVRLVALGGGDPDGGNFEAPSAYMLYKTSGVAMNIYGLGDLSEHLAPKASNVPTTTGQLIVHFDADYWGSSSEFVEPLDGHEVTIGRSPRCTIYLEHDFLVSRHHAVIRYRDTGYALIDLGSSNGTMVNGQQIATEWPLREGDQIRIGDCEIIYSTSPAPAHTGGASPARPPIDARDATALGILGADPSASQVPTMPPAIDVRYGSNMRPGSTSPNGTFAFYPTEANWAKPLGGQSAREIEQLASATGQTPPSPPAPDITIRQAQFADMVDQLRLQAETAAHQVERLKTEIAAIAATLSMLVETQRQLGIEGPDLTTLLRLTERTMEEPNQVGNVVEFVAHASQIDTALRALQDIYSSSGVLAVIESLRSRLVVLS